MHVQRSDGRLHGLNQMKTIPLSRGMVALVDDEDYERLIVHPWYAKASSTKVGTKRIYTYYAYRCFRNPADMRRNIHVSMHRQILGLTDPHILVDHANRNGLDNRRSNLRICTHSQNCVNTQRTQKSGFRGVYFHQARWVAQLTSNRVYHYLGRFRTAQEAAIAYDKAALFHFGEYARLNFPDETR